MSVFRIEKNKNYTVMSNHHLRNKELSLKAKELLSQMLSLPENWDYTLARLSHINKESIDAVRTAVWELEKAGYIKRQQGRDEKGKMTAIEYIIYEQPQLEKPILENPTTEKPILENPTSDEPKTENPTQINKDKTSTKELNTDLIKYPSINQTEQPVSTFATQTPPSASALLGGTRLIDRYNQNTELANSANVGRVVSPTLAMIVQREAEIKAFKSEPFYKAVLNFDSFKAESERFADEESATAVVYLSEEHEDRNNGRYHGNAAVS